MKLTCCKSINENFYVMQFTKKKPLLDDHSDDDVKFVPSVLMEEKLGDDDLKVEYGIGYKLLIKKGFKPGETLGLRTGITQPIKVNQRLNRAALREEDFIVPISTKSHPKLPIALTEDEVPIALDILIDHIKSLNDHSSLQQLLQSIKTSLQPIPARIRFLLTDSSHLRSFIIRNPLLFQIGTSDLVSLQRPPKSGYSCECRQIFATRQKWTDHILTSLESHLSYLAALEEMKGDPFVHCLICSHRGSNALSVVKHALSKHFVFAGVLAFGLLGEGGMFSIDFLCALISRDQTFDWTRFVSDICISPRSVISLDSGDECEVVDFVDLD